MFLSYNVQLCAVEEIKIVVNFGMLVAKTNSRFCSRSLLGVVIEFLIASPCIIGSSIVYVVLSVRYVRLLNCSIFCGLLCWLKLGRQFFSDLTQNVRLDWLLKCLQAVTVYVCPFGSSLMRERVEPNMFEYSSCCRVISDKYSDMSISLLLLRTGVIKGKMFLIFSIRSIRLSYILDMIFFFNCHEKIKSIPFIHAFQYFF